MNVTGDLLLQAPLLSLDSFVAGLALGPMLKSWPRCAGLACLFGLCDGAAVMLGAARPHAMPDLPDGLLYALVVGAVVLAGRRSKLWLLVTPVILSLDNLVSGFAADAAPALAVASAVLALTGMIISRTCLRASEALNRKTRSGGGAVCAR